MSQRDSGYARKERDLYETPEWVTVALLPHFPRLPRVIWEPACGSGKMLNVFRGFCGVYGSDISDGNDFLRGSDTSLDFDTIATNPPYDKAQEFIDQALRLTERRIGMVAMLLRTDFDHAKSRVHLFRDCPAFAKKVVLTKRIVWFEPKPGEKGKSPSFNHAWFIWDWRHVGPPVIGYAP